MRRFLAIVTSVAALAAASLAHAGLNFDFSFTNTIGSVSGTVTGEIFGLADNTAREAATDVVIDSYPAGLTLPATPWDIFNDGVYSVSQNSFSVSGGEITYAACDEAPAILNSGFAAVFRE